MSQNQIELSSLKLRKTGADILTCNVLKEILNYSDHMNVLDLSWNNLNIECGRAIIDGLSQNKNMKSLDLSWN